MSVSMSLVHDDEFEFQEMLSDIDNFVNGLTDFDAVIMSNDNPDIQVVEMRYDCELVQLLQEELGMNFVQTIVQNNHSESRQQCPYFRICTTQCSDNLPINFKLQKFYSGIGHGITFSPKCRKAVVVGLAVNTAFDSPVRMPSSFTSTRVGELDLTQEPELDLPCLKACAQSLYPESTTLCDIAGVELPYFVPWECQCLILSFCSSPTCDLIQSEMYRLSLFWHDTFLPMFYQREPRIPVPIASYYGASTVQACARDATRSTLAPRAR